jgi:hypothetical protein
MTCPKIAGIFGFRYGQFIPRCLRAGMKKLLSQKLKRAYIELEGAHYNAVHYQKNGNRYLKMIAPVLDFSKAAKILDIGGGYCYLTKFFKNQGYEISAIDFFYGDIPKTRCLKNGIPFYLLIVRSGFRVVSSGYVDEGICLGGNPLKNFIKIIFFPLLRVFPNFKDYLWVVAENQE